MWSELREIISDDESQYMSADIISLSVSILLVVYMIRWVFLVYIQKQESSFTNLIFVLDFLMMISSNFLISLNGFMLMAVVRAKLELSIAYDVRLQVLLLMIKLVISISIFSNVMLHLIEQLDLVSVCCN